MLRQFGERLAMNTPIQGSAADIIKLAMNKVYRELKDKYPGSRLILQIHDELIIEADTEDKEEIAALLRRSMEEAVELSEKKFFVGVQFHPEFKSRPNRPHPLFGGLIQTALEEARCRKS